MTGGVAAAKASRPSQGRNVVVSMLVVLGLWIGVVTGHTPSAVDSETQDQGWSIQTKGPDSIDPTALTGLESQTLEETSNENSEVFSWETSETSMGLSRSMTSSSWQIFSDLGMSLRARREKFANSSITECETALLRVVEHIKNASYSVEVQNILYNTGKVFNDVGYYTSCMNTSNLTYYLIRPINDKLTTKFNFGVCVPTNCTLDAVNILIAEDVINKKWLKHIANGTSYQPADYTSAATVVPTDQQFSTSAIIFMVTISILMGTTLVSPAIKFIKWAKTLKTSDLLESDDEDSASHTPETGDQASPTDPEENPNAELKAAKEAQTPPSESLIYKEPEGLAERITACWTAWGSLQYLGRGRRDELNSINAVKLICGFIIVYSTEYLRRQPVGTNQDDKLSLDRTYSSWGYNMAFMAPFAFDMLFFLSALTNTMTLTISLKQQLLQTPSREASGLTFKTALKFYLMSVGSRFMRLAPTLFIVAFAYHTVVPGLVTGPFEYLFATTYAQECSTSPGWAYSFVANLFKDTNYCTGSFSWYVFSMFQLYLVLPVYVLVCQLSSYAGLLLAITLATSSVCGTLAVFGIEDLGLVGPYSSTKQFQQYQDHYQSKPWAVGYCWFFGAILGLQMANRRLSELKITNSSGSRLRRQEHSKPIPEANKQTIASMDSVTKGSALTLTPNNLESLLGESNKQERKPEETPADLLPARASLPKLVEAAALPSVVSEPAEQQSVASAVLTVGVLLLSLVIPVAVFVSFVDFTRTKNEWGSVVQVGFDVISRVAIMLSTSVMIWHFGFTHEASRQHRNKTTADSHFTLLGAVSRFGLAYYLWAMLYIDWGMASQMVNQYYDSLLVFCYTMADSVVLTFMAIPLTLTVEIPLKRLFRFH